MEQLQMGKKYKQMVDSYVKVVKNPNLRSKLRKNKCKKSKIQFLFSVLMKEFKDV
jgi:hypothetical protein